MVDLAPLFYISRAVERSSLLLLGRLLLLVPVISAIPEISTVSTIPMISTIGSIGFLIILLLLRGPLAT
jgi:hypothetical protein